MRVLVTGAAGYVGSVLCQELLRVGHRVDGVDGLLYDNVAALAHLLGDPGFTFHAHDVRDAAGMKQWLARCDAVLPLAAVVGAPACDRDPAYATQVNLEAVRDLVGLLAPSQRLVFPNTNSGYGETDGVTPVTEEAPFSPLTHYGASKAAAEVHVLRHPAAVSLRLATVFGPSPRMRFDLLVNDFSARLARDHSLEVFEPHFRRNFLHVRDAARAFVFMLTHHRLSGAYNVGLPEANLTKLELAHAVAATLGLPAAAVTEGKGTDPDRRNYLVSNDKLLTRGFRFAHTLAEGVADVAFLARRLRRTDVARMRNQ